MKKVFAWILMLAVVGCSTIRAPIDPKAEISSTICQGARAYIAQAQLEAAQTKSDKIVEIGLDACGALVEDGWGYSIYHVDAWALSDHQYLGHVKIMALYKLQGDVWVMIDEKTVVFVEPRNIKPSVNELDVTQKVYTL